MKSEEKLQIPQSIIIALSGAGLGIVLNILLFKLGLPQGDASYQTTAAAQYALPLWQGLLKYGLWTPLKEEILYRGICYRFFRTWMKTGMAVLVSSLLFGAVHGNMAQAVYAFAMGCVMALWYEKYNRLLAPLLFHCAANISIYLIYYK